MKLNKDILLLTLFSIIYVCKPISYQEVAYRQYVNKQTVSIRGGNSKSTGANSAARGGFISQDPRSSTTTTGSGSS